MNWQITLLRFGLAAAGGLLLQLAIHVSFSAPLFNSSVFVLVVLVSGALGLSLLVGAGLGSPPHALKWIALFAYVWIVMVRAVIWAQTSETFNKVTIDPAIHTDLAGELLLQGENPYVWDITGAFNLYRTSTSASTPKLNAASVGTYSYPALPFLLTAPMQSIGLPGSFSLLVLAHIVALLLLYFAAPSSVQPIILFPIVAGFDFIGVSLIGSLDILWAVMLVGMILAWEKPTLRAVLYGLAASVKQLPWLVFPFLILHIWRDEDKGTPQSRVVRFASTSALTFMLINAFSISEDPQAWLRGVTGPLLDNFVFLSQGGLSSVTHLGFISLPKGFYLTVTLAVLGLMLLWYWRHYGTLRDAIWIFPGIFMWFSYRSLVTYWVYWVFPLLAALVTWAPVRNMTADKLSWKTTLAVSAVVLTALFALGGYLTTLPAQIDIRLINPMLTENGQIVRMNVEVENRGVNTLIPRFAIQRFPYDANPQPWRIESGAPNVEPGQVASYEIFTNQEDSSFLVHDAAQVVVTDASGDYALRGVATINPDDSFLWPNAIPNPDFVFWDIGETVPIWWALLDENAGQGSVALDVVDGREALKLSLGDTVIDLNRVALETWTMFPPNTFGIWTYMDSTFHEQGSVAYGLEVDDGQHTLRFEFGLEGDSSFVAEGDYVIYRPTLADEWALKEIDLGAAYSEAGWQLPELTRTAYKGMDTALRMVTLRLFLTARGSLIEPPLVYFGPIEQEYYLQRPQTLMAETLKDPRSYYVRLAEQYFGGRNYDEALRAYQRALDYNPGDLEVLGAIDLVMQHVNR